MAGGGVLLAGALIGGLYGGQWLDRRLGSAPVFLFVGVAIGAICGFTALYRQLLAAQRNDEEARKR
jgi:ATP synthase protein I